MALQPAALAESETVSELPERSMGPAHLWLRLLRSPLTLSGLIITLIFLVLA